MRYTIVLFLIVSSYLFFSEASKCRNDGRKVRIHSIRQCSVSKRSFEYLISVVISVVQTGQIAVVAIVDMLAKRKLQGVNLSLQ